jgi:hypothetical protein
MDVEVSGNTIYENEDTASAIDYEHAGSGIEIYFTSGLIEIKGNIIRDNNPLNESYNGAGIGLQYCDDNVLIDDNQIIDNHGYSAVMFSYSDAILRRNTIINPEVQIGLILGSPNYTGEIVPSQVINNIIANSGFYNIEAYPVDPGHNNLILVHNTLADSEYGLYVGSGNTISFDRGIVSDHLNHGIFLHEDAGIVLTVTNTLFFNNADNGEMGTNYGLGDPYFVDPVGYDYHIQSQSVARDLVSCSSVLDDIDSDPRPMGSGTPSCDMGADEFWWKISLPLLVKP